MIRFRDSKAVHRKKHHYRTCSTIEQFNCPGTSSLLPPSAIGQRSNNAADKFGTCTRVDANNQFQRISISGAIGPKSNGTQTKGKEVFGERSTPVNQPTQNLVCGPWQMDGFPSATDEPPARVPACPDNPAFRRRSFRFAEDQTDGLGVNSVDRCRTRSPILFRRNTAHEGARLT
jgi:hypothetical protein